jgi:3-hydroxyisobutyrate dehydrogenase-like beta-hydroxyacid dehydrogenase
MQAPALAFIGYGEVGQLFARQLLARPGARIAAYDLKLDDAARAAPLREAAARDGVRLAASSDDAARGADIVISAVTADQAEIVARAALRWLAPAQILFDVNSASPATKSRAAQMLADAGLSYVEGAIMAPVVGPGIDVSILAGGARAGEVETALNGLGMNIRTVSQRVGRASATKLCRSIMIKGIEALIIDSARASAHWGVAEDVFASLDASFPGTDWARLATTMDSRVARHGMRRAAEMREAAAMLAEMGLDGTLTQAVAAAHERRAQEG